MVSEGVVPSHLARRYLPTWLGRLGLKGLSLPQGRRKCRFPARPAEQQQVGYKREGSTEAEEQTKGEKASPGPGWSSYQGLMGGLVHSCHRIIRGWLQVVKCQLNVLLGRKGEGL